MAAIKTLFIELVTIFDESEKHKHLILTPSHIFRSNTDTSLNRSVFHLQSVTTPLTKTLSINFHMVVMKWENVTDKPANITQYSKMQIYLSSFFSAVGVQMVKGATVASCTTIMSDSSKA